MVQRFAHRVQLGGQLMALCVLLGLVAGAVQAQVGFTNLDPEDPIQFTADRLEVKKEGRVAAFIGNVNARQGDLNLSADIVKVYYQRPETDDDNDSAEDIGGFGGSISRIDTSGNVVIESHSEHILLRILRRIIETENNYLIRKELKIKPDKLNIYYFHTT